MTRSLLPLCTWLAVLLGGAPAYAQSALGGATGSSVPAALRDAPLLGVQDNAGFFHLDAIRKARGDIQQFRQEYHRDLFVETFAHVPTADQKRVPSFWRSQREQYFARWAAARAKAIGVDGVYVLICEKPQHVQVLVYPNTPEQAFSEDNARDLRKLLERELPQGHDVALADAVAFVRTTVQDNLTDRESAATSIHFATVAFLIAGVVGFWLLLSLVRAFLPRHGRDGDRAHAGHTAGFFGALFGTTAGHWVYDRLVRAHPPAAPQPESDFLHSPPPLAERSSEAHDSEESALWDR